MSCCLCTAQAQESWTRGEKSLLYMRLVFADDPEEPVTESAAMQALVRANSFFQAQSYGLLSITGVVSSLLALPETKDYYGNQPPILLMEDARAAARLAGYEPDDFDLDLIRYKPVPSYDFAGTSSVGSKNLWLQHPSFGVLVHELGHNLGAHHSSLWRTTDGSVAGPGSNVSYLDVFDTMGQPQSSPEPYHFNLHWKTRLDWVPGDQVPLVASNGTYRLHAYDGGTLEPGRFYGLRVRKDPARDYWLSHRQAIAGNDRLANGILLYWNPWPGSSDDTQLLDTTPRSPPGAADASLLIGRTFSDWDSAVHLTPLARGQEGGQSWIDVYIHLGNPEHNTAPSVQLTADQTSVEINQPVTLTATAGDADEDALAFAWDLDDGTITASAPEVVHQWSEPGHYLLRCRVSDRRGGTASASVLVTVGEPATFRISGTILTQGAQPLEDVLVETTAGRQTRTDSLGQFTLTGLAAGEHSLTAIHPGYAIQAGFSNPVTLAGDQAGADFTAVPQAPEVALQPQGATLERGQDRMLSVTATGLGPLRHQWQRNETDLPGATESSLALTNIQPADAGDYRVIVWNGLGTNVSDTASILVIDPPRLVSQPQDVVANVGDTAAFSFEVEGREPMIIQWQTPTSAPEDATNTTFTVEDVQEADAGPYAAIIFNEDGFVITEPAYLIINHPPVPAETTWERLPGAELSIPIAALLGVDPDDDPLSFAGFDATTGQGGSVVLDGETLRYTPPPGLETGDQFAYLVSDGRGGEASGMVLITVFPEEDRPREVAIERPDGGSVRITFSGDPERSYSVVYADDPGAVEWNHLGTAESLGAGNFRFDDLVPGNTPARYYRLRYP